MFGTQEGQYYLATKISPQII